MKLYVVIFFVITLSGCSKIEQHEPIDISCDKHLVAKEYNRALLAKIDGEPLKMTIHKVVDIPNVVIGSALFNCKNGVFIYSTVEMMKHGPSTLHLVFKNSSIKIEIKDGINEILPYGEDEILIQTGVQKRAVIDPQLGDMAAFERGLIDSPPDLLGGYTPSEHDVPLGEHIYSEDFIFNLPTKQIRKVVPGTFVAHDLQDGKFIGFTFSGRVIEFFPENGARAILLEFIDSKKGARKLPQSWSKIFYSNKNLFHVTGDTPENLKQPDKDYYSPNTISKYSFGNGWKEIEELDSEPSVAFVHDKKIIAIGNGSAAEYDTTTDKIKKYKLPLENYKVGAAGMLNKNYVLSGDKDEEAFIVVLSPDFKTILLNQRVAGLSGVHTISTMTLPFSSR